MYFLPISVAFFVESAAALIAMSEGTYLLSIPAY